MSPFSSDGDRRVVVVPINNPRGDRTIEKSAFNKSTWPQQADPLSGFLGVASRAKPRRVQPNNKDVSYTQIGQQGRTMGTDFGREVRVGPPYVRQDTNLDIEIEKTVRAAIDGLGTLYAFKEPEQVKRFLSNNNTLRGMLSIIYSKIRKEFPSEKITLEVFSDSSLSSEKDVVVSVSTPLPVDEAIERLDKVEDTRWNKDSTDPYVDVCVKLEYQ
jgi:hypothetical protein